MGIKIDQALAGIALQAAYQGQAEIGAFYHLRVTATFISLAAFLSVRLQLDADGFVVWAGDLYGHMVGETEAEATRGHNPRAGMVGIPFPGETVEFTANIKPDPNIWSRVTDALGKRGYITSAEEGEIHAATLLATAARLWVLCTFDRDSFIYTARHLHDEVTRLSSEKSASSFR